MSRIARKPELMSPAGGEAQLHAAVEAGADAVYFGLQGFNARQKAMAFNHDNLPEVIAYLHERGVMGFVAVNTLVFEDELALLEREIQGISDSGADAVIVQDIGAVKLIHEIAPHLPIHASTQMTVTSAEGAEFARSLGVSRAVLARELSLKDIAQIADHTDLELETFVHGALCVSYSGQCFSSEAWGGRSANRGACAQACRMPYDLIVDGEQRDLGEFRYLLSPQDLYALEQVPELLRIGVDCLKIEGRYKDAEYVAATTAAYRNAIDRAWDALHGSPTKRSSLEARAEKHFLEGVYSRGLEPAFIGGVNHQRVVHGRAPRHRGTRVGTVVELGDRDSVWVGLEDEFAPGGVGVLKPGDGLVFDAAAWRSPEAREEGGQIYEVFAARGRRLERRSDSTGEREVALRFANRQLDLNRIRVGDWVWRSLDPGIDRALRTYTDAGNAVARRPVTWHATGEIGSRLVLTVTDERGRRATAQTTEVLQPAQRRALDTRTLEVELGKLGDTPFGFGGLEVQIPDNAFLPLSSLGAARRAALEALIELRRTPEARPTNDGVLERMRPSLMQTAPSSQPQLSVLVRRPEQLEAAIEARPDEIVLDYLELYGLRPSVERILESGIAAVVASPRVLKPDEERIHKFLLSLPVSAILVRSIGLLHSLLETPTRPALHGDFSLNAANALTARHLLDLGLTRLAPTHDLNAAQISELAARTPNLEVILHHHLPVFHTEHCVFCRFLSTGTDHTNCGHPCETHAIALRDERGFEHPVVADVGCRNTVFEARAQTGAAHLARWQRAGINHFRLEFVQEDAAQVAGTIRAYRRALEGKLDARGLERELATFAPQGTTQGSFIVSSQDVPPRDLLPMV
jgi:putative protease